MINPNQGSGNTGILGMIQGLLPSGGEGSGGIRSLLQNPELLMSLGTGIMGARGPNGDFSMNAGLGSGMSMYALLQMLQDPEALKMYSSTPKTTSLQSTKPG